MHKTVMFVFFIVFCSTISGQIKIGVFDTDVMVHVMPGYVKSVDSILAVYTNDSLDIEYNLLQQEYMQIDSSYKADSIAGKSPTILDFKNRQKNEVAIRLVNWQQIAEYLIQAKRQYLARPFYEKVIVAFNKVKSERKYDLVLKPNTYEFISKAENVFVYVARELNVNLPKELSGNP